MQPSPVLPRDAELPSGISWFAADLRQEAAERLGFQFAPGGVHLSKTMMLAELASVLAAVAMGHDARAAIVDGNVLGKQTGSGRQLALKHLSQLYGLQAPMPVQAAALRLWPRSAAGRPLLALLCALAREPLLRQTAGTVLRALPGSPIGAADLAAAVTEGFGARYSVNTLQTLARNCASTWTQSGHLRGLTRKRRATAEPSPEAAAYAALLGGLAGFGGPALLRSPWMQVLDRPPGDLLALLRRAEAVGLGAVRAAGGVVQVNMRQPLADLLDVPALAHG